MNNIDYILPLVSVTISSLEHVVVTSPLAVGALLAAGFVACWVIAGRRPARRPARRLTVAMSGTVGVVALTCLGHLLVVAPFEVVRRAKASERDMYVRVDALYAQIDRMQASLDQLQRENRELQALIGSSGGSRPDGS